MSSVSPAAVPPVKTLATLRPAHQVVVDPLHAFVLWNDPPRIARVALATGTTTAIGPSGAGLDGQDADNLYWFDWEQNALMAVSKTGGARRRIAPGDLVPCDGDPAGVGSIHPLGGQLFFKGSGCESMPAAPWRLLRVPAAGGAPVKILQQKGTRPRRLALDATHAYWSTEDELHRAPLAGGTATVLADAPAWGTDEVLDLAELWVDEEFVYGAWVRPLPKMKEPALVQRVPKTGGPVTVVALEPLGERATHDRDHVYFATSDGRIVQRPLRSGDGGAPSSVVLAAGQHSIQSLAANGSQVVWCDDEGRLAAAAPASMP